MLRKIKYVIPVVVFMLLCIGFVHSPNRRIDAQSQTGIDERERQIRRFAPAKRLLQEKGVPFEPEAMLLDNWKNDLAPVLDQIPDMHISRAVGNRMEGVQMADALYLPEKVRLTGDTIIIARKIVFEGHNAVLKGPHNIYYFPVEAEGVLGMTLQAAMRQQMGSQFVKAKFSEPLMLERFKPQLLKKDWSLTIDSSGYGWQDWLEDQKERELLTALDYKADNYRITSGPSANEISLFKNFVDCTGTSGTGWDCTPPTPGALGRHGDDKGPQDYQPVQAESGLDDNCLIHPTSSNPDFSYLNGDNGDPTLSESGYSPDNSHPDDPASNRDGKSQKGGTGIRGGDAGDQIDEIFDTSPGTHFFYADGGTGG